MFQKGCSIWCLNSWQVRISVLKSSKEQQPDLFILNPYVAITCDKYCWLCNTATIMTLYTEISSPTVLYYLGKYRVSHMD